MNTCVLEAAGHFHARDAASQLERQVQSRDESMFVSLGLWWQRSFQLEHRDGGLFIRASQGHLYVGL